MKAVADLGQEIRTAQRRLRDMTSEDPEALFALARQRDAEDAKDRKRALDVAEANAQTLTAAKLARQVKDAGDLLKKKKQEIMDVETVAEARNSTKNFSLAELGHQRNCGGGQPCKKRRFEVLDRLSRIGQGLSAAQKSDFNWEGSGNA